MKTGFTIAQNLLKRKKTESGYEVAKRVIERAKNQRLPTPEASRAKGMRTRGSNPPNI